jgi:uncharacterized protein (DUF58 family)
MQFSKWVTLAFGALCMVAVAGVVNGAHLYYMAAILLTLPGVSYALGWNALRGISWHREPTPTAWEGEEGSLIYTARNEANAPRYFLSIHDELPEWIVPLDEEPLLFNVAAGDSTRVIHRVMFRKRGVFEASAFEVVAIDPLGVFAFNKKVNAPGEVVIYPTPQQMRAVPVTGAGRFGWQEMASAALRGSSVEPDGVRLYSPGDPLRRIHWRQTARTGRLSVIEFEEPQATSIAVLLDCEQGTEVGDGADTTFEYCVNAAASVGYQAVQDGAEFRLFTPERSNDTPLMRGIFGAVAEQGGGQDQLFRLLEALARVNADSPQNITSLTAEVTARVSTGTVLIVVTANADPALAEIVRRYTASGGRVIVLFVDPATFADKRAAKSLRSPAPFFDALMGAEALLFTLERQADGALEPHPHT